MGFALSQRSLSRLEGVDERLVVIVKKAIDVTRVDFGVTEGLRSVETQRRYVKAGKSQTFNSKHLEGKAVDLVAYIDGTVSWELNVYDDIADAIKAVAIEKQTPIRWGAAWTIPDICEWPTSMEQAMNNYIHTRVSAGVRPFIDTPHFELVD